MTSRERIDAAFLHRPTDRIPIYQAGFSSAAASLVLGRVAYTGGGIQQYREAVALWEGPDAHAEYLSKSFQDAVDLCVKLDLDMVRTSYWRKEERPTARLDANTFRYGDPDGAWEIWRFDPTNETYCLAQSSPRPEPGPADLAAEAERACAAAVAENPGPRDFPDHVRALERFGATHGIPGTGVGLCIPRDPVWLEAIALYPEIVARYLDAQVISARKCIPVMVAMGLPYLFGGGDLASTRGPLYSPAAFRTLMTPRFKAITEACREAGAFHLFASDGDIWSIADDLFSTAGIQGFYEVDRDYMPMTRLRERYPRLTLLGGIRSQVLHRGSVDDVIRETRSALEDARKLGGCVVGCSNQIVIGTPERNIHAMMETLHRER